MQSTPPRPAPDLLCFGDIAAGPGGFSEYLLWRRGGAAKGFGFTLRGDHDFETQRFHHRASPELFHAYYGPHNDGDLYDGSNIRGLAGLVARQTEGKMLHVVMADGGFDVSGMENIQEVRDVYSERGSRAWKNPTCLRHGERSGSGGRAAAHAHPNPGPGQKYILDLNPNETICPRPAHASSLRPGPCPAQR